MYVAIQVYGALFYEVIQVYGALITNDSSLKKKKHIYIYFSRTTTSEEMPRIRWATIKPLGSKVVVTTITLLITELLLLLYIS